MFNTPKRFRVLRGRARACFIAIALWSSSTVLLGAYAQSAPRNSEYAAGRILVMPRAGLGETALGRVLKDNGALSVSRIGNSELRLVALPAGSEVAVANRLARNPLLKFAELDRKVDPVLLVNDPYAGSEWQLPTINAPSAWDLSMGSGVTIAVLDSGVLGSHVDLVANMVPGWNAYDGGSSTGDVTGHGTAVAGTAAAATNNGSGVASVAGAAKIMPIRITDNAGTAYYSTIARGITYAADRGVRVVNCSYGTLFQTASIQSAGAYLKSKGGLLIVGAGNNGVNENAAATTSMVTVSATDGTDTLTGWSSYGSMVSVSAPGLGIWTTSSDGGYSSYSGTSLSTPVVAGVVALMMSANPALSASQIESLLFSTAVDLGPQGKDIYHGNGRVDAYAAVRAAKAANASADTQAPSVSINAPLGGATVSGPLLIDVAAVDNLGVTKVELRVNGHLVATDSGAPFQLTWDSTGMPSGSVSLTAVAFDAAGNSKTSGVVTVNVANNASADTTPPLITISNPANGSTVGGQLTISVASTDDGGSSGITQSLYIDGVLKATVTGSSLSYRWNTRKAYSGGHKIEAVAIDRAGNRSNAGIQVTK